MSGDTDRFMPIYIGDYLRDTSRLNTEEHGAYLLIIFDYWINGSPPDNDKILAAVTRLPLPRWKKIRSTIEEFFTIIDGRWRQNRADKEIERAIKITIERSRAGKVGAEKRWQSAGKSHGKAITNAMANSSQIDAPSPSPLPSFTPSIENSKIKPSVVVVTRKRARSLSVDWSPSQGLSERVKSGRVKHELPAINVDLEAEKFRNYYAASGKTYIDWDRAFQNWCFRARPDEGQSMRHERFDPVAYLTASEKKP